MIADKMTVKFWNGQYYCAVRFPDGTTQELKSAIDLTFTDWQKQIDAAWSAHLNPPVEPVPLTLDEATKEQVAAEVKERGWTAKDLGLEVIGVVK